MRIKPKPLSPRHVFANRIATLVRQKGLNTKATAKLVELDGRKFYQVEFKDVKVNVYAEDFIQFEYKNKKKSESSVFETKMNALKFFNKGVLEENFEEAAKIPTKKLDKKDDKE